MRFRRSFLVAAAAATGGLAYFMARQGSLIGTPSLMPIAAYVVMLLIIAASFGLAAAAVYRAEQTRAESRRLSRAMESAMRSLSARQAQDSAVIADLRRSIARLDPQDKQQAPATAAREAQGASNGTAYAPGWSTPVHAPTTSPLARAKPPSAFTPEQAAARLMRAELIAEALHAALDGGGMELSLEPILSIDEGATVGLEAHAHLTLSDGSTHEVRRLAERIPGLAPADFEGALLTAAIAAARRQTRTEKVQPLHVALSGALLGAEGHVRAVVDLAQHRPYLLENLILSIPDDVLAMDGEVRAGFDALAGAGFRFAVEGMTAGMPVPDAARFIKLPARILIDRRSDADLGSSPVLDLGELDGVSLIATNVSSPAEAIAVAELGVKLMTGENFASARRFSDGNVRRVAPLTS